MRSPDVLTCAELALEGTAEDGGCCEECHRGGCTGLVALIVPRPELVEVEACCSFAARLAGRPTPSSPPRRTA
jgi:hypothetical protein